MLGQKQYSIRRQSIIESLEVLVSQIFKIIFSPHSLQIARRELLEKDCLKKSNYDYIKEYGVIANCIRIISKVICLIFITSVLFVCIGFKTTVGAQGPQGTSSTRQNSYLYEGGNQANTASHWPGRLIIKIREDIGQKIRWRLSQSLQDLNKAYDIKNKTPLFLEDSYIRRMKISSDSGEFASGLYQLEFEQDIAVEDIIKVYQEYPEVEYAIPDYIIQWPQLPLREFTDDVPRQDDYFISKASFTFTSRHKKTFSCEIHAKVVNEEILDAIIEFGVRHVKMGIEAGDNIRLAELGKEQTIDDVKKAVKLIKSKKLQLTVYLLLGGPGSTIESAKNTYQFCQELGADDYVVNMWAYYDIENRDFRYDTHFSQVLLENWGLNSIIDMFWKLQNPVKKKLGKLI